MKTLILYATKHGAAAEIAKRMAHKLDDAVMHDLKNHAVPDFADFECVIVGASIYAGSIRKEAKEYISQNADALSKKRLGLFISGMSKSMTDEQFNECFPGGLTSSAKAVSILGGIFDPKKANFFEKLIMKMVTKQSGYVDTIDDAKIDEFLGAMAAEE